MKSFYADNINEASESSQHITSHKYDALAQKLKETQDYAANQQHGLEKKARALQEENRSLREEVDEGQSELSALDRQYKHQLQELESKHSTLEKSFSDIQADLGLKSSALKNAQDQLTKKESEAGHLESEVLKLKAQAGDADTLAVIKKELSDQVSHIRRLETTNREQSTELKNFRRMYKAIEVVEEEKRALEAKISITEDVRRELREAQLQRQILEDEKKAWTSYLQSQSDVGGQAEFDSPEALARALVKERLETASLTDKLGAIQPELLEKDEIINSLEEECSRANAELGRLRSSGGGGSESRAKARLERQRALAVKEVEYLREQLRTFDSEELTYTENQFDEQKKKRIQNLESLVDQYRAELQTLNSDLSKREGSQPPTTPSLKRPREDEQDDRLGQLTRKNRSLQDSLSNLQTTNGQLTTDLNATKTQLSSLQQSSQTRILALRSNPTSDLEAIKMSDLENLKKENAALLSRLLPSSSPPPPVSQPPSTDPTFPSIPTNPSPPPSSSPTTKAESVPLHTLRTHQSQIRDLESQLAEKEKRMLRLKQIWSLKSQEFREAILSLLGWRVDFQPNGRFRLTSVFRPGEEGKDGGGGRGEENTSLMFDGETGTMKICGGPGSAFGREVRGLVRFWVEERGEVPGFLAAATLQFYDESTRAARALKAGGGGGDGGLG